MSSEEKYDKLIDEFIEQRDSIKEMIKDLENFKENVDKILPSSMDKRYVKFFEEKIKTVTELFKVILDMRKEITKNIKDEFELRRKLSIGDDDEDLNNVFDIRKIADKVEKLRREKTDLEQKINDKLEVPKQKDVIEGELNGR